jgi:triphosphatase
VRALAFTDALTRLAEFSCRQARCTDWPAGLPPVGESIRKRLRRLRRRIRQDGRRFPELPFDQQHDVRKRLKRLQFLTQFVAPQVHLKTDAAWQKRADKTLAALGRHIDLCQATRTFQAIASLNPQAWFAIGWLRAKQDESARAGQQLLARLSRTRRI